MRFVVTPITLALVYLAVVGAWNLADAVLGLLSGAVVAVTFARSRLTRHPMPFRALARLPWFLFGVVLEVFRGTWKMLLVLLGLKSWRTIGYVQVPVAPRTHLGANVNALAATTSPGSVLVDLDEDSKTMTFNTIDARNPQAFRENLDRFYTRYQKPVLP